MCACMLSLTYCLIVYVCFRCVPLRVRPALVSARFPSALDPSVPVPVPGPIALVPLVVLSGCVVAVVVDVVLMKAVAAAVVDFSVDRASSRHRRIAVH